MGKQTKKIRKVNRLERGEANIRNLTRGYNALAGALTTTSQAMAGMARDIQVVKRFLALRGFSKKRKLKRAVGDVTAVVTEVKRITSLPTQEAKKEAVSQWNMEGRRVQISYDATTQAVTIADFIGGGK